ncbi:hypothetical protein H5202_10905 [Shewanella sp. SG41-4]|uniref:hypothetical protein n=1 Tax=Shewanella sp. SG41-4 TaxID=2760976 RepID=UPI001603F4DD|nr:hypothetical protein [Shewanella sp. SG41-4]MBB1439179.1 hypothetical protein [Shewanella sp. SG41-4]
MLNQQKADDDLLKVYGRVIAIIVVLVLLTIFGVRYVNTTSSIGGRGVEFEHNRFLNVLAMVRSQWLASGRPKQMLLSWYDVAPNVLADSNGNNTDETSKSGLSIVVNQFDSIEAELVGTNNWIKLSSKGWPLIDTDDVQGCQKLWQQLLATKVSELNITVEYQVDEKVCRYVSNEKASLSYQLQTGRVIFLTGTN